MRALVLAQDEVLRLLSTRRGLFSLAGFFLVWIAILIYGVIPAANLFSGASESGLLQLALDYFGARTTELWPAYELNVYWVACLYLLPFLAILTAADQTASDRDRGTLRYLVLRCGRLEIFFGRFLGQLIIMLGVVLTTLGSVLLIIALNSAEFLPASVASAPPVIVNLMLLLAPYIALMAVVSILARSARQATLYAMIIWVVLSLLFSFLRGRFPELQFLDWALPGSQVSSLRWLTGWETLSLAPIPIFHTVVFLCIGAILMKQRDL